jgi:hypothetical protein
MTNIPEYHCCDYNKITEIITLCQASDLFKEVLEYGFYANKGYAIKSQPNIILILRLDHISNHGFCWAKYAFPKYGYHYYDYLNTEEVLSILNKEARKVILNNLDLFT